MKKTLGLVLVAGMALGVSGASAGALEDETRGKHPDPDSNAAITGDTAPRAPQIWANKKTLADRDGDGIDDSIEGKEINFGGHKLTLNPKKKDVVILLFYYGNGGKNRPTEQSIAMIVEMFKQAPVKGLGGKLNDGVNLEVIVPQTGVFFTGQEQDERFIGSTDAKENYDWSEYDTLKANVVKSFKLESIPKFYHTALVCNEMGGQDGSSGLSRNAESPYAKFREGAVDFIAALYTWPSNPSKATAVAGTIAHELGHNLGLTHGGFDHVNYKPNYLSVMNYLFQFEGLYKDNSFHIDYQSAKTNPIDERDLHETRGLGSAAAGIWTMMQYKDGETWKDWIFKNVERRVDWNGNGRFETKPYKMNLNPRHDKELTWLAAEDNWDNVNFTGGGAISSLKLSPSQIQIEAGDMFGEGVVLNSISDYPGRHQYVDSKLVCPPPPSHLFSTDSGQSAQTIPESVEIIHYETFTVYRNRTVPQ